MKVTLDNIKIDSISEHLKSYMPSSMETTIQALARMSSEELYQKTIEPLSISQAMKDIFDKLSQNESNNYFENTGLGYLLSPQQNTFIHDRFFNPIYPQISFHHSSEPPIKQDNQKSNKARFPWD
ncbi:MAG: hypothetical protein M0P91_04475 [Sulfuricurvum sp.]|uniref:hypothetical protein n=1 Tax=Sulfuricurvum sp. TaxID=2025608 RepID=UPI0025E5630B|nr:hypothetical protein [Sulfuricurvum sp.]MCK9372430.1 hypothetical protein [Sulfuricurvum sp.]